MTKSLLLLLVAWAVTPLCIDAFTTRHRSLLVAPPGTTTSLLPSTGLAASLRGVELRNLLYDSTSTAFDAWEWTANLGAPAALVAGAVLVTLSETRGHMAPRRQDKNWVRLLKQSTRFLLLSSFALEVVSIFVSTMTGTVLLSHGEAVASAAVGYTSPLELLHHHHEFEYLTIQLGFLQGLIHWLGAVALEFLIPRDKDTVSARRMNQFMASSLVTLIFWIMAFYNHHLTFYSDYLRMVVRYVALFGKRYLGKFRPMSFLYIPASLATAFFGWRAFNSEPHLDDD